MKKTLLLLTVIALLVGCNNTKQKPTSTIVTKTPVEKDTVTTTGNPSEKAQPFFEVETYGIQDSRPTNDDEEETADNVMSFKCSIDIPVTDNQALHDSICHWIAYTFNKDYDGDPRDVKTLVNRYKDQMLETNGDDDAVGFDMHSIVTMQDANERYVTYRRYFFYEEDSAPRSYQEEKYITFNRQTGKHFTRQMINMDESLKQEVMNALFEQYFSEWSSEVLADLLFFDPEEPEEYGFFLPQFTEPWILHNHLYFGYTEHEIADRCTGQPQCCLPYHVMEKYLTDEGKAYFFTEEE